MLEELLGLSVLLFVRSRVDRALRMAHVIEVIDAQCVLVRFPTLPALHTSLGLDG